MSDNKRIKCILLAEENYFGILCYKCARKLHIHFSAKAVLLLYI